MTITITDCTTGAAIAYAQITDVYGDTANCNGYGVYQVDDDYASGLLSTEISVSSNAYTPGTFTITSNGNNSFCLSPVPPQEPSSGGGVYSIF